MTAAPPPLPAPRPCGSCPYRRDVPAGVWDGSEYEKLPLYDAPTGDQPSAIFKCHQDDGRACAGWVACNDMAENLAIRLALLDGRLTDDQFDALLDYETPTPLFGSGQEAADHGRSVLIPGPDALRIISKQLRGPR